MGSTVKRKNYKYDQIAQTIIAKIASGEWAVGSKIPPEFELCQMMNVSRVTLRESLKTLSMLGILRIVQGDGTYVEEISPASFIKPLLPLLKCNSAYIEEVYAARIIVEGGCCGLTALNRTEEDLAHLHHLLDDMRDAVEIGQADLYSKADKKFHQCIIDACGNDLLKAVCNMFSELVDYYIGRINENTQAVNQSICDHTEIYVAIRNQRSAFATMMMSEHLKNSMSYLRTVEHT